MGREEKKLKTWLENTPVDGAPISQVRAVLERYFPGRYQNKPCSHIIIKDERLKGLAGFDNSGRFSLPVSHGQRVKRKYLKDIARAVEIIRELESNRES